MLRDSLDLDALEYDIEANKRKFRNSWLMLAIIAPLGLIALILILNSVMQDQCSQCQEDSFSLSILLLASCAITLTFIGLFLILASRRFKV